MYTGFSSLPVSRFVPKKNGKRFSRFHVKQSLSSFPNQSQREAKSIVLVIYLLPKTVKQATFQHWYIRCNLVAAPLGISWLLDFIAFPVVYFVFSIWGGKAT